MEEAVVERTRRLERRSAHQQDRSGGPVAIPHPFVLQDIEDALADPTG